MMIQEGKRDDFFFMQKAIALARRAEELGNLPIGAVIALENKIIAEGYNTILKPEFNPARHAEMIALDNVPVELWSRAREMTCYTTMEPCCMCFGRLLLSQVGRIVFGSKDPEGGAGCLISHLPKYYCFDNTPIWEGPLMPDPCDELFLKSWKLFQQR